VEECCFLGCDSGKIYDRELDQVGGWKKVKEKTHRRDLGLWEPEKSQLQKVEKEKRHWLVWD
jgi:hypothetical protein